MNNSKQLGACRTCSSKELENILDLGEQPLANALLESSNEKEDLFPLRIVRCQNCGTVQLSETIEPDILFKKYVWVTGTSSTALEYSEEFCIRALARSNKQSNFIVEVASNDGTFLEPFKTRGHKVLGIDPAKNIAEMANKKGIATIDRFFGKEVAKDVVKNHGKADILFARNVIPHVADIKDVIGGIEACLSEDGVGIIEFHSADKIVEELHYDSIYHEHLFYHSLDSILFLLGEFGLNAFGLEKSPISGGSHVIFFSKTEKPIEESLAYEIRKENELGLNKKSTWINFADQCINHRNKLLEIIERERASGNSIVGYGASARSSTLMNYCGLNNKYISGIADKSPLKHNKYTPGTHILIESPEKILSKNPDTILLLAWNFQKEIIEELKTNFNWSGKVIMPLPNDPTIIEIK